jgi:xanthosine utilization system XapX-like protein
VPYLAFNQWQAGEVWPNTFYAKQAEYAIMLQEPLLIRVGRLLVLPLVGAGVLLLPGVLVLGWQAVRERSAEVVGALLWWGGYTVLYALRLPVTYQHGRYLMPAMPVFWALGVLGILMGLQALPLVQKWRRRATMLIGLSFGLVNVVFWGLGAWSYGQDVAIIETEMVTAARWIGENTPDDALVAAHDVGALGYFGKREIVDLAGLISPEVIPFMRDEEELNLYLEQVGADYLMTFPNWYPRLTAERRAIFVTGAMFSPRQGGENMAIYAIKE